MAILVTGGCGFIGSNFIRRWLSMHDEEVVNVDKMTYAADPTINNTLSIDGRYAFYQYDICDTELMKQIITAWKPRAIIHFAAESHVDRSIEDTMPFMNTNVFGTVSLLNAVKECDDRITFIHVSTDEVYGSLKRHDLAFTEKSPYDPRSPYSASKAASDHFVNAYRHTHGLQTIITNCSNNYGPWQHPEKLIPTIIRNALAGTRIPIYGTGLNIRDWIYVIDHVDALIEILERGEIGQKYNIGGNAEYENIQVAKMILDILGKSHDLIEFVPDRKGHDFRYAINSDKVFLDVGWKPRTKFIEGLEKTVLWYQHHTSWVSSCQKRSASF